MWQDYINKFVDMYKRLDWSYLVQFITLFVLFYIAFKILKENKGGRILAVFIGAVLLFGISLSMSSKIASQTLLYVVVLGIGIIFILYNTEIKRNILDSGAKKHAKNEGLTVKDIEYTIEETIRAVQHMSKNDIGALIVLSNDNLPDGIIASGTVINADINAPMIEAVFYPKAPLHDGAMIIEGNKIYAAGCFLPLVQNENLPQDVGSRHRAAMGVTQVASVTAIVVSEETGIISIVKNGEIKKRYASDADLKNALSEFYWTDLTAEVS